MVPEKDKKDPTSEQLTISPGPGQQSTSGDEEWKKMFEEGLELIFLFAWGLTIDALWVPSRGISETVKNWSILFDDR